MHSIGRIALLFALLSAASTVASQTPAPPRYAVIDMHFHADRPDAEGPPGGRICAPYTDWAPRDPGQSIDRYLDWFTLHPDCPHALVAPTDAAVLRDRGIAMLQRYDVLALAGGEAATVEDYRRHAAGRILPAAGFGSDGKLPPIAELRRLHADGRQR